jgi:haloacetate dehalogenase
VIGHDRGARVTHRMVLDHPQHILKFILLDIAPTVHMYKYADCEYATAYWHWFLFIQPYPVPETLLQPNADEVIRMLLQKAGEYDATALDSYCKMMLQDGAVEGTVADYRASKPGGIDATRDEGDQAAGRKISRPMRILWGTKGIIGRLGPEKAWGERCEEGKYQGGKAVDSSHYIPGAFACA